MIEGVHLWWAGLCGLAVLNLGLWSLSSASFFQRKATSPSEYATRWPHLVLSAGYVLGCAFRSVLPRADVQRIVLYDSWLSSVMVGRSVATIAELCFVAQWALILRELSLAERDKLGLRLSYAIVPMIAVAEVCSWYAVLSTNYLGNALEQSIWTLTAGLLTVALVAHFRRAQGSLRWFLGTFIVAGVGFVVFMCSVDIPMYVSRFIEDQQTGRPYLPLVAGVQDVSQRWVVTHSWHEWREEIAWMTLYFSLAVWMSIALVHAPRLRPSGIELGVRHSHPPQRRTSSSGV